MLSFQQITLDQLSTVVQTLGEVLPEYRFLALEGTMGSGKTTLTMALLDYLGSPTWEGSPTFSIIQPYELRNGMRVYHIDAYRITNDEEAFALGLEELFATSAYFIVEWPEKIRNFLPERRITLTLETSSINHRNYTLTYGY